MGGDSIKTIFFVGECDTLLIKSGAVYKYRTPEILAAFCDDKRSDKKCTEKIFSFQAMKEKIFPVFQEAYQNYLNIGVIFYMYSSFFVLKEETIKKSSLSPTAKIILKEDVDPIRLQNAVGFALSCL